MKNKRESLESQSATASSTRRTFPEINGMNLKDARYALHMARLNFDALTREGQAEFLPRITALENRVGRLLKTQGKIDRQTLALQGAGKSPSTVTAPTPLSLALAAFPGEFGLCNFPGEVFKVSTRNSYMAGDVPMLYLDVKGDFNGTVSWTSFCKGTAQELRDAIVSLQEVR